MRDLKSFTLHPRAGEIVDSWKKKTKSRKVSEAIVKYQKWKEWHYSVDRQKTPEDMRFYYQDELMVKYNDKCIEVTQLKEELALILQASKPKQSLIARLFSSNDE